MAGYEGAGKTGTAQVISRRGTAVVDPRSLPMHLRHRSLFVGFAPADNPTIAIAISVEVGGYGGSTAGPMARSSHSDRAPEPTPASTTVAPGKMSA